MGNTDSLPDRINEEQAKELAGELWNQYIFDAMIDDDGLAAKQDVVDAASEALMAFQGESVEIMRVTSRRKKSTHKSFKSNQELGQYMYEKRKGKKSAPNVQICQMAHLGQFEDLVAMCEMSEASVLDTVDIHMDRTALQIACTYNFVNICEYLIEKGCDMNKQNHEMKTALHYAAQYGNWEIVNMLLKANANKDTKDNLGRFAGDWVESDYSGVGFVKKDASLFEEMMAALTPKNPNLKLYRGTRTGKENDPPSAEVVAVEISDLSTIQMHKDAESLMHRTSKSFTSNDLEGSLASSRSLRKSIIAA